MNSLMMEWSVQISFKHHSWQVPNTKQVKMWHDFVQLVECKKMSIYFNVTLEDMRWYRGSNTTA